MTTHEILFIVVSYLIGSIPCGFLIYYISDKKDIRKEGSGNIGATNLLRIKGKKAALITLICDMLKGALPIAYGLRYFDSPIVVICGGAAAVIGHLFPIYLKFKGGKGVATLIGVFLIFDIPSFIVFIVTFFAVFFFTNYVSAGSIAGVSAVFFYTLFTDIVELSLIVFIIVVLILCKHISNIKRMMAGTENRLTWNKNG